MQIDNLQIIHPRAAGFDIQKMQITATVRLSQPGSDSLIETGTFSALPDGLAELVGWLGDFAVTAAVMEATGVYWRAPCGRWKTPASRSASSTRSKCASCAVARRTATTASGSLGWLRSGQLRVRQLQQHQRGRHRGQIGHHSCGRARPRLRV